MDACDRHVCYGVRHDEQAGLVPERGTTARGLLTLNGGSSTVKAGLFTFEPEPQEIARQSIEGTGAACVPRLQQWLAASAAALDIVAVGHRIVHGGTLYRAPCEVTPEVVGNLRSLVPFAPNHLPPEIELLEAAIARYPDALQCACFDTAFHASMPEVARRLPLPREFASRGVQKYGFHGLSYAFLMEELRREAGAQIAGGRVILAHLGNGCSLAAVHGGRSLDTTMGLTPIGGVIMGTRSGDLDPGVVTHLGRAAGLSADALEDLVSRASGLLAISGLTSDMKTLLARERSDDACRLAVDMFAYSVAKAVGALSAALRGVDVIVFSGGIGEHAPVIRSRVLERLTWLGVDVDAGANETGARVISTMASRVSVRVIPTDEERMIARSAVRLAQARDHDVH
jgi:acetate kinase